MSAEYQHRDNSIPGSMGRCVSTFFNIQELLNDGTTLLLIRRHIGRLVRSSVTLGRVHSRVGLRFRAKTHSVIFACMYADLKIIQ